MANLREILHKESNEPRPTVVVRLPNLNIDITLRQLRYGDVKDLPEDMEDKLRIMLGRMIVDDNGERVYISDYDTTELDVLTTKDYRKLTEEALKLNGYGKEVQDETIKNSVANPNGASASVLPVT